MIERKMIDDCAQKMAQCLKNYALYELKFISLEEFQSNLTHEIIVIEYICNTLKCSPDVYLFFEECIEARILRNEIDTSCFRNSISDFEESIAKLDYLLSNWNNNLDENLFIKLKEISIKQKNKNVLISNFKLK